jgi:Ser-tRNA(Ala) deacylase AlaX
VTSGSPACKGASAAREGTKPEQCTKTALEVGITLREQAIEARCNALIRAACAVRATVLDSEGSRGALANSPILRGALPPPDTLKGPTRVVEIAGVDINACGGTHLRSTAELQVQFSFTLFYR